MKPLAVRVVRFAAAGKFRTAPRFRSAFTRGQQSAGNVLPARTFPDIDSLRIPHRAGFRPFHIVMAELPLGKARGRSLFPVQKDCRILPVSSHLIEAFYSDPAVF